MSSTLSILRDRLIVSRNADHGWGYLPGRASRIEPTAWAVLALADDAPQSRNALVAWRRHETLLVEAPPTQINYAYNALAAIALAGTASTLPHSLAIVRALMGVGGVTWTGNPFDLVNPPLRGWSWSPDTFSWVEPTALCLIAAKRARRLGLANVVVPRIQEAEQLLFSRVCSDGGWNYGNPYVFGKNLRAQVPATAVALIALQDRRHAAPIAASLQWLRRHALSELSTMGVGLATIALSLLDTGRPSTVPELEDLVRNSDDTASLADLAIAAYALGWERHAFDALRF